MSDHALEIVGLRRSFGGLKAVDDVSFSVARGEIKSVIGPNGAGKTTLFNLVAGTLRPENGTVRLGGREITGLKPHKVAALGVARTFQTTRLFLHMSALENVMVGRHIRSRAGFISGLLNLPWTWREERAIRTKAEELLGVLGISELAETPAGSLSFGQQRLVEFARALAMEPSVILLDEPAAGLNIHETQETAGLIQQIRKWGITVVLVEHDISLVMDISDSIVVLDFGRKIAEGLPQAIQKDPEVIRIYLGSEDDQD